MNEYWVYRWLDSKKIRNVDELHVSMASPGIINELKDAAQLIFDSWRASPLETRDLSLIAGAGIDLSGRLDCNATECRRAQVDRLFRRAWHYFPSIVARDAIAEDLVMHAKCPDSELLERLVPHFETVLIVRELGAEQLVEFLPRRPACFKHFREHAREAGIDDVLAREEDMVDRLLAETRFSCKTTDDGLTCTLHNPDFAHSQWVDFSAPEVDGRSEAEISRAALRKVVRKFIVYLTADVNAAKLYGGALGSTIPMFQKLLANRGDRVSNIALQVELPVLEGLSITQLVDVRLQNHEAFMRFRKRLGVFLEKCVQQGMTSPADLRTRMKKDLIESELDELRLDLRRAEESLKRKSAYALGLASLVVTIGVTTGIISAPVAFGLAATVTATSLGPGVGKYVDDMVKLKSHDMYFLLQAEAHSH